MRFLKRLLQLLLLLLLVGAGLVLHNNFGNDDYNREELQTAYDNAVAWLGRSEDKLQKADNPVLVWMLRQTYDLNADPELKRSIDRYIDTNRPRLMKLPWRALLLDIPPYLPPSVADLLHLPYYNLQFIYGFSCDAGLAALDIVAAQNDPDFCRKRHPLSPACLTHQMMGFRFMQRYGCHAIDDLPDRMAAVAGKIRLRATMDFRVLDVYLQRVLMLQDSGRSNWVRSRWIRRILDHQLDDGSWGNHHPIISLGRGRSLGFSPRGFKIRAPGGNAHTTVQGIWLLAMALDD